MRQQQSNVLIISQYQKSQISYHILGIQYNRDPIISDSANFSDILLTYWILLMQNV